MSRIALQVVLGLVALVAIVTGVESLVTGAVDPFYGVFPVPDSQAQVNLDTNLRYFAGLWLGIGLVLPLLVFRIERRREALWVIAVLVFVGGVGRVISMVHHGLPHPGFVAAAAAELLFPLVVPWQRALAKRSATAAHAP